MTHADGLAQACHCHYGYIDELHAKDAQNNKPLPSESVLLWGQRLDLTRDRHCYNLQASQVGSTSQRMRRKGIEHRWMTAGKPEFLREKSLTSLRPPQI